MCIRAGSRIEDRGLRIEERTGVFTIPVPQSSLLFLQSGGSLIELIMFIVIVSTALAGIMLVMNTATKGSADPLLRKQAMATAYSLLEEVELQDFIPRPGIITCTTNGNTTPNPVVQNNRSSCYHIVSDYNGFAMTGIYSLTDTGSVSAVLPKYNANVTVTPAALGAIAAASAVQINVTVTGPNGTAITATGYRTAY